MRRDDIRQMLGNEHVVLVKRARRFGAAYESSMHPACYSERHEHPSLVSVLDEAAG